MDGQRMVSGTRTMGDTRFTPMGSMTKGARQVLFDDLIEFEREAISGGYDIQTHFTPIGLFLAYKNVNTWTELFDDVYGLNPENVKRMSYAHRSKRFLDSLEQSKNLEEAIEFVASGFTDIKLFRSQTSINLFLNLNKTLQKEFANG